MTQRSDGWLSYLLTCLWMAPCFCFLPACNQPKDREDTPSISKNDSNSIGPKPSSNSATTKTSKHQSIIHWTSHGSDVGIDFTYHNGEEAWMAAMIESNGGGLGYLDFDRDGRWDVFFPGGGRLSEEKIPMMVPNGLFRQTSPWHFENCSEASGTKEGVCYSFGINVGDFDEDGFSDIFISGYAGQQLLHNMGDGTFEDVTSTAGFRHRGWSSSAAWCDIDRDGDLDIYIAHYGVWSPELDKRCFNSLGEIDRCDPSDFEGEPDELWLNEGDGHFKDVSERVAAGPYRGIGVVACDWDGDGYTDFFVSNDGQPNTMFSNHGDGYFDEIGARSGVFLGSRSIVDASMGIAVGDFDGNLKPDILVTNYENEYCELYSNQGNNYFTLGTRSSGLMALGQSIVGWGTAFLDADHDGDEDAVIVAGHTSRKPVNGSNEQPSYMLENIERKRLISLGKKAGNYFESVHAARGLAIGDLDNDGDIDLVVSMVERPAMLLENTTKQTSHYLLIDLVGTASNRDAIGAIVEIEADGLKQVRHRFSGGSYASTHASSLHFGLGASSQVQSVTIQWPSGRKQILEKVAADQRLLAIEPVSE